MNEWYTVKMHTLKSICGFNWVLIISDVAYIFLDTIMLGWFILLSGLCYHNELNYGCSEYFIVSLDRAKYYQDWPAAHTLRIVIFFHISQMYLHKICV